MQRKPPPCSRDYPPRSSWPIRPMTPITCAKPSPPKGRSPSSPTTHHVRSNIHSTSISMPSAISSNAASQSSSNSAASRPASKKPLEITAPSSLSQPSSYGCDKCPHHLERLYNEPMRARRPGGASKRYNHELDRGDICGRPDCNRLRALFGYDHDPLFSMVVWRNGRIVQRGDKWEACRIPMARASSGPMREARRGG